MDLSLTPDFPGDPSAHADGTDLILLKAGPVQRGSRRFELPRCLV